MAKLRNVYEMEAVLPLIHSKGKLYFNLRQVFLRMKKCLRKKLRKFLRYEDFLKDDFDNEHLKWVYVGITAIEEHEKLKNIILNIKYIKLILRV